jgi:hypothetical protein
MATVALLWIAPCLDRVDRNKVAAMAFGFIIAPCISLTQVVACAAALMAIKAPLLLMTLAAIVAGFTCQHTVPAQEVCVMVGCNAFSFMTAVAIPHRGIFILGMGRLLFGIRLLLEADKSKAENCYNKNYFFHACLLS